VQTVPRVLGFGSLQAQALSQALDAPAEHTASIAELGALFNLGIVLFDWLLDHAPEHAGPLRAAVTPGRLSRLLDGQTVAPDPNCPPAIDCLLAIIADFCRRSGALETELATGRALRSVVQTMYAAEIESVSDPRPEKRTAGVGTQMRAKSVLPIWTIALVCLHPRRPPLTLSSLRRLEPRVAPLGEMLWLIDDMVDLVDDWETQAWNQLWQRWQEGGGTWPASAEEAVQALLSAGLLDRAIADLVQAWHQVRSTFAPAHGPRSLDLCWRATIQSWVYGLPA
jgi:hypothetical protein